MKLYAKRLQHGKDLKQSITDFAKEQGITAGVIISAVGSLSAVAVRMAGARPEDQDIREYTGSFEITSVTGTISEGGAIHAHISVSNHEGELFGGHVKEGCQVNTTVELVIAAESELRFTREPDEVTGFDELVVRGAA